MEPPREAALSGPLLVLFEGIDGSGKSSQVRRLGEALRRRGLAVVETREPTDGTYGREIRRIAREGRELGAAGATHELELFIRDRREHVNRVVRPALAARAVVLQDRGFLSSVAYQGAAGLEPKTIRVRHDFIPRPDIIFLLDITPEEALRRKAASRPPGTTDPQTADAFEDPAYLTRVRTIYLAQDDPQIIKLDASLPEENVARDILARTLARLRR